MPVFEQNHTFRDREELDSKKSELADLKTRRDTISSTIADSFSGNGSITRKGLERELLRLDVLRRSKNPVDAAEQSLIQGQQNEITYLLQMEHFLLTQKKNILERINELETQTQTLIDGLQRRSKNDAT